MAPFAEPNPPWSVEERINRPSVDELLDRAAKRRITLVIGAAALGKTTAVATWSCGRSAAWLRCEDPKDDADRLLASLFAALLAQVSTPILSTKAPNTDEVASSAEAICGWLRNYLSEDVILVLDDLHALQPDSDAARAAETLCQQAPDRLHLILLSRHELPFSLQRVRGRGLVAEIHAPDLAFDVADMEALLRKTVGTHPPGLSRQVWDRTGGWPAAVHCASRRISMLATARYSRVSSTVAGTAG